MNETILKVNGPNVNGYICIGNGFCWVSINGIIIAMANKNPILPPSSKGTKYIRKKLDPRVALFKQYYLDTSSTTYFNIFQSAMKAGYSKTYSSNISTQEPDWWVELIENDNYRRACMLKQAEKNLQDTLIKEPEDTTDKKIKADATKFVSERLGKDHYSTRKELTDKGGRRLFTDTTKQHADIALEDMFLAPEKQ